VWLEGDLTGLKFGDELQNAAKEELGSMKFILPLDVFGLLVDFDTLVLLQNNSDGLLALPVEYALDALQFPAGDEPQPIVGNLGLTQQFFLVLDDEGVVVAQGTEVGVLMFVDQFFEEEDVRLGDADVDAGLLLRVVLEHSEGAEHFRELVVEVGLAQDEMADPLQLEVVLVYGVQLPVEGEQLVDYLLQTNTVVVLPAHNGSEQVTGIGNLGLERSIKQVHPH
jgi:hypothetical protein